MDSGARIIMVDTDMDVRVASIADTRVFEDQTVIQIFKKPIVL